MLIHLKILNNMKLVKNDSYLLLIDEEAEIKEGDYIECELEILKPLSGIREYYKRISENKPTVKWNKIIAYYPLTKEAKELDLPLLPPFKKEVDVEKLACNIYNLSLDEYEYINEDLSQNRSLIEEHYKDINREEIAERYFDVISFIAGYNAAQSKQFSLEDMKKAFQAGSQLGYQFCDLEHYYREQESQLPNEEIPDEDEEFEEFIQSLSPQQLPKEFVPEYKKQFIRYDESVASYKGDGFLADSEELKTIINSEGREELVGTYKYENSKNNETTQMGIGAVSSHFC